MRFDRYDYNENVDYCEYVFNYALEHNLTFDKEEIQIITNNYVDKLEEKELYDENNVVKNDTLLKQTIYIYLKKLKANFNVGLAPEDVEERSAMYEKNLYNHGGYDNFDSYDDMSYDDLNSKVDKFVGRK